MKGKYFMFNRKILILAVIACIAQAASAETQKPAIDATPYSGDLWNRPALTGDWGGARNELATKGITFDMSLTQVWQKVESGGRNKDTEYGGRFNIIINMDFQKMGLWPGAFLMIEAEQKYDSSVNPNTGAIMPANTSSIYPAPGDDGKELTVPAVLFTQFLSESFGVIVGKFDTARTGDKNEFAWGKGDKNFMNLAFGVNPCLLWTAPYSTLGAGVIVLPTKNHDEWIATFAVMKTEGSPSTSGLDDISDGPTSVCGETRLKTDFFGHTGHQLVGASYSDRTYISLDQNLRGIIFDGLAIKEEQGSWAAYYNFDQYLYEIEKGSGRGWGLFGRLGTSDGEANPIDCFASAGIGGKGVFGDRKDDSFGIGYYRLYLSDISILPQNHFGDEQGVEAFYNIAVTRWMYLTPDIQFINPGQSNVDNEVVAAMRLHVIF
jgi:porin